MNEQNVQGAAYVEASGSPAPAPDPAAQAFALLMSKILGTSIVTHVPGYVGTVTTAPNMGSGLDYPVPSIVAQVDGEGNFVDIWWKSGVVATAWTPLGYSSTRDDHKVATDETDQTAGGSGYLLAKHSNNGNVKFSFDGSSGRRVRADVELPDPEVLGTYLYTTRLLDPLVRTAAKGILHHGEIYGFGTLWETIAGVSTWQCSTVGPIYMRDTGGRGTVAIADGDRFWVWQAGTGLENVYFGLYEAVDCGYHVVGGVGISTYAVIRRVADANTAAGLCSGMIAQILGVGVEHNNEWLRITTSNPITPDVTSLDIEVLVEGAFAPAYTYALLTAAQMSTQGAPSDVLQGQVSATGGDADLATPFETLVGTPGVDQIPAGPFTVEVESVLLADYDPTGVTRVKARLIEDDGGAGVVIWTGYSAPITWGLAQMQVAQDISFQVALAADYTFDPTHRLYLALGISTTCTAEQTLLFWYNSSTHGTRIKTTVQFPVVGGTNWHPDLLGRDQSDQHPWDAMQASGRAAFPIGVASSTSGMVTIAAGYQQARLVAEPFIFGLDTDGFSDGAWVMLFVSNASPAAPVTLVNNAEVVGTIYAFGFPPKAGQANGQNLTMTAPTTLHLWLDATGHCWRLRHLPVGSSEVGT
jgi:hypothetical protein